MLKVLLQRKQERVLLIRTKERTKRILRIDRELLTIGLLELQLHVQDLEARHGMVVLELAER